ncbi:MAG: hypothetical protein R3D67_01980 [Hyphomicrobiaceae bacterium]
MFHSVSVTPAKVLGLSSVSGGTPDPREIEDAERARRMVKGAAGKRLKYRNPDATVRGS